MEVTVSHFFIFSGQKVRGSMVLNGFLRALGRQRAVDLCVFEASQGDTVRSCLKKNTKTWEKLLEFPPFPPHSLSLPLGSVPSHRSGPGAKNQFSSLWLGGKRSQSRAHVTGLWLTRSLALHIFFF